MIRDIVVDDEFKRSQKLQRRWRQLQSLAADIYHSDLSDAEIAHVIIQVRAKIDGNLGSEEEPDQSSAPVIR